MGCVSESHGTRKLALVQAGVERKFIQLKTHTPAINFIWLLLRFPDEPSGAETGLFLENLYDSSKNISNI